MRLGWCPCWVALGSQLEGVYGQSEIGERHRHRYEFNNDYRDTLTQAGLVTEGTSPAGRLVEEVKLPPQPGKPVVPGFHRRGGNAAPGQGRGGTTRLAVT